MKKLTAFETSIIGLLIGVVVSAYLAYATSSGSYVGKFLEWVSLRPALKLIELPEAQTLIAAFILTILVFTIYGAIVGLIVKKMNRSWTVAIPIALLFAFGTYDQVTGKAPAVASADYIYLQTASVVDASPTPLRTPKQYFGAEALGDLNADGHDDVAFLIHRNDKERGTLYYIAAALTDTTGKTGTNLVFLGDKVEPVRISIENGIATVEYTVGASTSTQQFQAHIVNGELEKLI